MKTLPFMLNDRFKVEPDLNMVHDREQGKEFRLEPRLMNLLCLLAQNKEEMVTRETITREIWDNYGNPDESLTQAISYLRKVLSDQQKRLIETVPKKGYMLRASVTEWTPGNSIVSADTAVPARKRRQYPVVIFSIAAAIVVILLFFRRPDKEQSDANPGIKQLKEVADENKMPSDTTTEMIFPGMKRQQDHNYLNTVTTSDSSGTRYRLVMIGDRRPEFYVDDSLQSTHEPYDGLIDKMAKELWERQKRREQNEK